VQKVQHICTLKSLAFSEIGFLKLMSFERLKGKETLKGDNVSAHLLFKE
jgi:hypothetical protein